MNKPLPLVTVIVPTTTSRTFYNKRIIRQYTAQDYPRKKILLDLSDGNIGEKRNSLCSVSPGDIILHMDSDDNYAPDWITRSVNALIESKADIVGLTRFNFHRPADDVFFHYHYSLHPGNFLCDATLCYWKTLWEVNPFPCIQIGEGWAFTHGTQKKDIKVFDHNYQDGFLATIHPDNTSAKVIDNLRYKRLQGEEVERLINLWGLAEKV